MNTSRDTNPRRTEDRLSYNDSFCTSPDEAQSNLHAPGITSPIQTGGRLSYCVTLCKPLQVKRHPFCILGGQVHIEKRPGGSRAFCVPLCMKNRASCMLLGTRTAYEVKTVSSIIVVSAHHQ